MRIDANNWYYSPDHGQLCQVIEAQTLWGETTCRVWLPGRESVVRIPASRLKSLESAGTGSPDDIAYVAAAARVADALTQDVLLAPIESSVIPLPHQIQALSRAIANDRARYLLADEVGLGKTIEAGLIMRELKLRGLVKRTLVIAPKGLVSQWVSEMRFHFGETFQLVLPEDIKTLKRIAPVTGPGNGDKGNHAPEVLPGNAWQMFSQVVVPMDSVKPLDRRRGWTTAQMGEHNRERFEDMISAGWDLVIVDEAHRLGGSTDQVARFKLGQGLSEAAPYFLMLSATPHQGKTDAFHRLVSLIDAQEFPDISSVTRERVQPYVIRTEKRRAIDTDGKPLFRPRRTQLGPVSWEERHRNQQLLYEAVTEYVRQGYNQAMREKRSYIGFLMILMQRLVVSSTSAIRTTLERRLEALAAPQEQLTLFPLTSEEEWADLDGQEQIDALLRTRIKALNSRTSAPRSICSWKPRPVASRSDRMPRPRRLYRLQSEEGDPGLKALVFTEFVPTQEMLRRFLTERGFSVVCLNGSMDMEERKRVQESFARETRILISTDAGGEGLNLQFCHVAINYDIPWNPMKLEQRIGRVDRIGQAHAVRAVNFVFEGSVEHRVREVLEQKLAIIFEEFGIDKTGDVLDSGQAGRMFDDLYVEAILNPEKVEDSVESVVASLQEQAREARTTASVLGATEDLEPGEAQRLLTHPLPHWVECMTVSYLKAHGGQAERKSQSWNLTWPDGETYENVVFTGKEAERLPAARHLTLEEPKVRSLAMRLPRFAPGQPVPIVSIPSLSEEVQGVWSLWRIAIATMVSRNRFEQIGLDRLVRLSWLEKVSSLVLAGNEPRDIKTVLQDDLQGAFHSTRTDVRESMDKTITILLKVWLKVPPKLEPLRVDGLELLKRVSRPDHLAVHWGMVMAVYPFWSGVATQVGRLLRLQGSAAAVHVQRRIREQHGEQETVSRRARYVLRSYLDWGVLQESGEKGIYSAGPSLAVEDSRLIAWLAEASLHARANGSASLKDLLDSPSLFPFRLKALHAESLVATSSRLDILRHGLDDDLVMLRKQPANGGAL